AALAAALAAAPGLRAQPASLDSSDLGGLEARAIGPAVMSGRIAAIDAKSAAGKLTIWVGAASGGVWKSTDGGITFKPVFDDHVQSIGAVAIDPSAPDTVWVGTGESCTRTSVSIGRGVYKTTDGGEEWTLMGLGDSERIAAIRVHPAKSDTAWVCATGHLWDGNEQRGVFKTTDGGRTWKKVLYVDQDTGCADLDLDPQNPDVLYAGMWQFRRYPDFFESGGPGSGLFKSTDGGETWKELTQGLPKGDKGRIAVAVAPTRPSRVYATVESEDTALYRSDDLGASWTRVNNSMNVTVRPFYFSHLVVDPTDYKTVYKPGLFLGISTDSGESFTSFLSGGFGGGVHADHHALWINPADPKHLVLGTDGGVYISNDQGRTFRMVMSLPVSQFYEVSVDDAWPYNVYGGLQDNGSWMGPSRSPSGIENKDWRNVGFGDGFHTYRDPGDPDYVYSEYQGGQIHRLHLPTGELREIKPYPAEGDPEYRFNWNTPIAFSPHRVGTVYLGAQKLLRSRDHGGSWEEISPDLTTDNPAWQRQEESGGLTTDNSTAENHTTIFAIDESPVEEGVIWVGTDDGNVQVTRDGGGSWAKVSDTVPGLPERRWISHVAASPHTAGTAFVTADAHRTGDMGTYVFKTADYGATWTSLATEVLDGFAHVIEQDPVNPDLLFLGTELGLWLSLDGGSQWVRFEGGFPKMAPVNDLVVHPRDGDLVVATHGRGIYILDDLTPLRNLTAETLAQDAALLPTRAAVMVIPSPQQQFGGQENFVGRNPPEAAEIAYYLKRRHLFGDLKVEIRAPDGELLKTVPGTKRRGINRVSWPMRLPPPKVPPATNLVPAFEGPRVLEGTYEVRLVKGDQTYTGQVELVPDPRTPHSEEDRRIQQETSLDLYRMLERLTYLVDALTGLRDQARSRAADLGERSRQHRDVEAYADLLEEFRTTLVSTSEAGWLSGDEKLREKLGALYGGVNSYTGRPTQSQLDRLEVLRGHQEAAFARFEELAARREELNRTLSRAGREPLILLTEEAWREREAGGR
ncbi:MAG TPA: glycosyl hydrolase, partial [Thermoanaerobaculia bacterium]|nr:glycosyl hydrolase [Thermoanaerobaculia bacterium]